MRYQSVFNSWAYRSC